MVRINTIVATRYAVKHTSPTARRCWARKVPAGQRLMSRGWVVTTKHQLRAGERSCPAFASSCPLTEGL